MDYKRDITLSIDQARELYYSNNEGFKQIALTAFPKEALDNSFTVIKNWRQACEVLDVNPEDWDKIHKDLTDEELSLCALQLICKAFNKVTVSDDKIPAYMVSFKVISEEKILEKDFSRIIKPPFLERNKYIYIYARKLTGAISRYPRSLCFKSLESAVYCVTHFWTFWQDFIFINSDILDEK